MKRIIKFMTMLSAVSVLGACGGQTGGEETGDITISLNPTALIIGAEETAASFVLTCNSPWNITTGTEWVSSITPASGKDASEGVTINVSVSVNDGGLRMGTLEISCGEKTKTMNISQAEAAGKAVLGQAYLMKATLTENSAGFNMLSDPSFEDYSAKPLDYMSPWWAAYSERVKGGAQAGDCFCRLKESIDENIAFQTVCTRPETDYELSAWFISNKDTENPDTYMGLRVGTGNRPVNKDVCFGSMFSTSWVKCSMTANSKSNPVSEVFAFSFHKDGYILGWDNVCLRRPGDTQKSWYLTDVSKVASMYAGTSEIITSADGCTAWSGKDGAIMLAFGENVGALEFSKKANAIGTLESGNVVSVLTEDDKVVEILPPASKESGVLPTAGVYAGGKHWIHYQSIREKEFGAGLWKAYGAGLAYSEDGKRWTRSSVEFDRDGNFVEAAFLKDGGYVYMYGSHVGRSNAENTVIADEHYVKIARCPESGMADASSWKYWNGSAWVEDEVNAVPIVYAGTLGELSVIKNSTTGRYLMLYSSAKRNAIVIRDAASPEGDWSGESIVYADTAEDVLYAPSFLPVSAEGNEIRFIVNTAWGK